MPVLFSVLVSLALQFPQAEFLPLLSRDLLFGRVLRPGNAGSVRCVPAMGPTFSRLTIRPGAAFAALMLATLTLANRAVATVTAVAATSPATTAATRLAIALRLLARLLARLKIGLLRQAMDLFGQRLLHLRFHLLVHRLQRLLLLRRLLRPRGPRLMAARFAVGARFTGRTRLAVLVATVALLLGAVTSAAAILPAATVSPATAITSTASTVSTTVSTTVAPAASTTAVATSTSFSTTMPIAAMLVALAVGAGLLRRAHRGFIGSDRLRRRLVGLEQPEDAAEEAALRLHDGRGRGRGRGDGRRCGLERNRIRHHRRRLRGNDALDRGFLAFLLLAALAFGLVRLLRLLGKLVAHRHVFHLVQLVVLEALHLVVRRLQVRIRHQHDVDLEARL